MIEAVWGRSTDLIWMMNRLHSAAVQRSRWGRRKLRLFAVACCRAVWDLLSDPRLCSAVRVAERYADGDATREALAFVHREAEKVVPSGRRNDQADPTTRFRLAALAAAEGHSFTAATGAWRAVSARDGMPPQNRPFCDWLRDLIPDPFHRTTGAVEKQQWLNTTVTGLARAAYEDRLFERLPILADALEEAGCDNADLLSHLRGPGPHVRGCWALDLILGLG
jgi:hypothetical protein